jgi:hypothetical protein
MDLVNLSSLLKHITSRVPDQLPVSFAIPSEGENSKNKNPSNNKKQKRKY